MFGQPVGFTFYMVHIAMGLSMTHKIVGHVFLKGFKLVQPLSVSTTSSFKVMNLSHNYLSSLAIKTMARCLRVEGFFPSSVYEKKNMQ